MATRVGIVVLALMVLGRASSGAPSPPQPLHVQFTAPPGCSHVGAFYAGVMARTDRVRPARPGEPGPRFRVRLTRTGTKVHGEVSLSADRNGSSTRKVDGRSCKEVVEALSLTVALALDPRAGRAAPGGPAPPPAASSTPPTSSTSVAPGAAAPRAEATGSTPPPPEPAASPPEAAPPPPDPRPDAPANPVAATAPPPVAKPVIPSEVPAPPRAAAVAARRVDTRAPRTYVVDLGAQAVAANVVSPYVSLGASLSLWVTGSRGEKVPPAVGIALLYLPNDVLLPPPDVVVRWTALALTACPPVGFRGFIRIQPCLLGMGGWLAATETAVSHPLSAGRSWWSAGALLRAALPLGGGLAVDLDLGITAPLLKRRFVLDAPQSTVGETPAVSLLAGIGVSYSL